MPRSISEIFFQTLEDSVVDRNFGRCRQVNLNVVAEGYRARTSVSVFVFRLLGLPFLALFVLSLVRFWFVRWWLRLLGLGLEIGVLTNHLALSGHQFTVPLLPPRPPPA